MTPETLSFLSDVSAIFLLAQCIFFTFFMAVLTGWGWWNFRKLRKRVVIPLLYAQVYALRAQHITTRVSDAIAAVPIGIYAGASQVKTTVKMLTSGNNSSQK